jgi:hypothetical protein
VDGLPIKVGRTISRSPDWVTGTCLKAKSIGLWQVVVPDESEPASDWMQQNPIHVHHFLGPKCKPFCFFF